MHITLDIRDLDLGGLALFLDFDGTLVNLGHYTPMQRVAAPETIEMLVSLRDMIGGALAIVSGRTVNCLEHQFSPERFVLSGEHGATWKHSYGGELMSVKMPDGYERAREACARIAGRLPGVLFEHKGFSLLLQFHKRPELREELADALNGICDENSGLRVLHGHGSLELTASHATKGAAVERFLLERPFLGRRPVFIGDDVSDEDAFQVVNAVGGISIKVGEGVTAAKHRLANHRAVLDWLGCLLWRDAFRDRAALS